VSHDVAVNGSTPHPMAGHDAFTPGAIATRVETRGVAKAEVPAITMCVLALVAGASIALGAVLSTTVASGSTLALGPTRWLAGIAFSLGVVLVIAAGAELVTGNKLIVMGLVAGHVKIGRLLQNWDEP
jgi:formate/nitrite transporter FocA (FNT family)